MEETPGRQNRKGIDMEHVTVVLEDMVSQERLGTIDLLTEPRIGETLVVAIECQRGAKSPFEGVHTIGVVTQIRRRASFVFSQDEKADTPRPRPLCYQTSPCPVVVVDNCRCHSDDPAKGWKKTVRILDVVERRRAQAEAAEPPWSEHG